MAYDYGWVYSSMDINSRTLLGLNSCEILDNITQHIEYIRASQCEWARLHMDDHGPIPWHVEA